MKKVLYLSYDGMTDPLGQSQVLPYLAGLSKNGFQITLISAEKPARFAANKGIIEEFCKNSGINWQPIPYTYKPPVLSTLKDIRNMRRKAAELQREHGFDLVHCRSYISALVGLWMKKKFGVPFLFDMRGLWADERVDGNLWNRKNPLFNSVYKFFKRREIEFLQQSAHTISLTQNARTEILSWPALKTAKLPEIEVIPCCVDLDLFNPGKVTEEKKAELKAELNIKPGDFVLTYLGSLGTWYMLDDMLGFFLILKQKVPHAKFMFITHDEHERLRNFAREHGFEQDLIIRPAPRKEVPALLSISNASIYFIKDAYSKKGSSPTKQAEIMAMGVPAICNVTGDIAFIADRYHIGWTTNMSDESFEEIANDIAGGKIFDSETIIRGAHEYYSLEDGVKSYNKVYQQIFEQA